MIGKRHQFGKCRPAVCSIPEPVGSGQRIQSSHSIHDSLNYETNEIARSPPRESASLESRELGDDLFQDVWVGLVPSDIRTRSEVQERFRVVIRPVQGGAEVWSHLEPPSRTERPVLTFSEQVGRSSFSAAFDQFGLLQKAGSSAIIALVFERLQSNDDCAEIERENDGSQESPQSTIRAAGF
jgi:hypothetical protein